MAARKVVRKKPATKTHAKRRPAASASGRKRSAKGTSLKRPAASRKKVAVKARVRKQRVGKTHKKAVALGRPRVAGTAELELMFRKDLEAREVCEFLRVKTLKELEAFSPDEILQRLAAPIARTVERIRKALAMNNRCLNGDERFAVAFKKQLS